MNNAPRRGPMRGPGMKMGTGEKAKDFKSAVKRLFSELKGFKTLVLLAIVLSILSAVLSIAAPNKLSDLTNAISDGLKNPIMDMNLIKSITIKIEIIIICFNLFIITPFLNLMEKLYKIVLVQY